MVVFYFVAVTLALAQADVPVISVAGVGPEEILLKDGSGGVSVHFEAAKGGTVQWFKDGVAFTAVAPFNGTSSIFMLNSERALSNSGTYTVKLVKDAVTYTSAPRYIKIADRPHIDVQPANVSVVVGTDATITATVTSESPITYQWYRGTPGFSREISGATQASLTLPSFKPTNGHDNPQYYYFVVTTVPGVSETSKVANVTALYPPQIVKEIAKSLNGGTGMINQSVTLEVEFNAAEPYTLQWLKDGVSSRGIASSTRSLDGRPLSRLKLEALTLADAGNYSVKIKNSLGEVTSAAFAFKVDQPLAITKQPVNSAAPVGGEVTLSVEAVGVGRLKYAWYGPAGRIAGATSPTLKITNLDFDNGTSGNYSVTVNDETFYGELSKIAWVWPNAAPKITRQPQSVKAGVNWSVYMRCEALGAPPLKYTWRHNGVDRITLDRSTWELPIKGPQEGGDWQCVVSNVYGATSSQIVTLTITEAETAPYITVDPVSVVAAPGETATFSVAAHGNPAPTYQWRKDGAAIAGATSATLTLSNVTASHAGTYTVVAANSQGQSTSRPAVLTISTPTSLPSIVTQPQGASAALGQSVSLSVVATGPGTLQYQWLHDGNTIAGATQPDLTLGALQPSAAGNYSVVVTNSAGSVVSATAVVKLDSDTPSSSGKLVNISSRGRCGDGSEVMIAGFVLRGPGVRTVLVRVVGPTLTSLDVADALKDPKLELYRGSEKVLQSDDWGYETGAEHVRAAAERVGAFPLAQTTKDAAFVAQVTEGSYTAIVTHSGTPGVALIEVYDAGDTGAELINISTRGAVGTGGNLLIAGFVVRGTTPRKILLRAVGAPLSRLGVEGSTLKDPQLRLFKGTEEVAFNEDWKGDTDVRAAGVKVGAFAIPDEGTDACLLLTLQPGAYTAHVTGKNGVTGIALVEVYDTGE